MASRVAFEGDRHHVIGADLYQSVQQCDHAYRLYRLSLG